LSDEEKTEILKTYNDLREKYQFLNFIIVEYCIVNLYCNIICIVNLIDQWEKLFEILEMLKIANVPRNTIYSTTIYSLTIAAFKNKKFDIVCDFLSELMSVNGLMLQNIAYISYVLYRELERKENLISTWQKCLISGCNAA